MKTQFPTGAAQLAGSLLVGVLTLFIADARAASVSWINTAGGNWNVGANWSTGTVPTASDDVSISAAGIYVVTQNVNATVASLTLGGVGGQQTLMNDGLTVLTLNGASTVSADGVLSVGGGLSGSGEVTIEGHLDLAGNWSGAGRAVVTGTMNWQGGGRVSRPLFISSGGALTLASGGNMRLSGVLTNQGRILWSGSGDFQLETTVNNLSGALFEVQSDARLLGLGGSAVFVNAGTLRKSAGPGTTLFSAVRLLNTGTVDVRTGTVSYITTGTVFDEGSQLIGGGTNLLDAGTITLNGSVYAENLVVAGATITGTNLLSGIMRWMGGWMDSSAVVTIGTNGTLMISGAGKRIYGTLNNRGTVTFSGTSPILVEGFINNLADALFDIQADADISRLGGSPSFTNAGLLRKSGGTGSTSINGISFSNIGTVEAQSGKLVFTTDYMQTGGTLRFGLRSLTDVGRIQVTGHAAIAGTLALNLAGGYVPDTGSSFAFLAYGSQTGGFTAFDLPTAVAWQTDSSIYGSKALTLTVLNVRPTLNPTADRSTDEQAQLGVPVTSSDPDPGQTLSYALLNPPGNAVINASSGMFSWTPDEAQGPMTHRITDLVTDNGTPRLSATQQFNVVVNEVNRAPTLLLPATQTVNELTTLTVTSLADDADFPANPLRFDLVSGPAGMKLEAQTGVLTWTPTEEEGPGTNTIVVAVTDNGEPPLSATNSFTVIVLESNVPPVLARIPDLAAIQVVSWTFTNTVSDADLPRNALTFDLVKFPSGMTIDPTSGVLRWTPTAVQAPSTNAVTVRVTDNGVPPASDSESFTVSVHPLPALSIGMLMSNATIAWPDYAAGFALQFSTNLGPPILWYDDTNTVGQSGSQRTVTVPLESNWRFFRLRIP